MKLFAAVVAFLLLSAGVSTCATGAQTRLDATAVSALTQAFNMPHGHEVEYGGAVFEDGGVLGHTLPPHTDKADDHVSMNTELLVPPGAKFLATYHTHPCMSKTHYPRYFSPQDIGIALLMGVPSYILDECSGDVLLYNPATDMPLGPVPPDPSPDGKPDPFPIHLFMGRVVGNIGAKGEDQDAGGVLRLFHQ